MGSVASINPGVADLLQTLSNLTSPVFSSPEVTSALENAPPADIVQLSIAANQLEGVDAMFGISDGSNADTSGILANLGDLSAGSTGATASTQSSSTVTSTASPADQVASYQTALQSAETQGLLDGSGSRRFISVQSS